jgi:predicted nucleic acid-binding protein
MVLVDTSVWVEHLRHGCPGLEFLLDEGDVLCHPFIIGELACGRLSRRAEILALLRSLPQAAVADPEEVLSFLDTHRLMGVGLGFIDVHLLAAARLHQASLWTLDRKLQRTAERLGVGFIA